MKKVAEKLPQSEKNRTLTENRVPNEVREGASRGRDGRTGLKPAFRRACGWGVWAWRTCACACGVWRGGFWAWRRFPRADRRATYTNRRRGGMDARVRPRRAAPWG